MHSRLHRWMEVNNTLHVSHLTLMWTETGMMAYSRDMDMVLDRKPGNLTPDVQFLTVV